MPKFQNNKNMLKKLRTIFFKRLLCHTPKLKNIQKEIAERSYII